MKKIKTESQCFVVAWCKVQNCFNVSGIVVGSFTSEKKRCT